MLLTLLKAGDLVVKIRADHPVPIQPALLPSMEPHPTLCHFPEVLPLICHVLVMIYELPHNVHIRKPGNTLVSHTYQ